MSAEILRCEAITKHFSKQGSRTDVLRGIDLSVKKAELVSILGHSGAGKSTLMHIMGTLEEPSSGNVWVDGESTSDCSGKEIARIRNQKLAFIFQFHYLLQEFTALENVLMPALIAGEPEEKYRDLAMELLRDVGLDHRVEHRPGEMSGGEQQRVAVARSLIMQPSIILADEPTGNLDRENSKRVKEILLELNRSRGVTLLVVTHDHEVAGDFPRQIEMKDGCLL